MDATKVQMPSASTRMTGVLRSLLDVAPRLVIIMTGIPVSLWVFYSVPPDISYNSTYSRTLGFGLGSWAISSGTTKPPVVVMREPDSIHEKRAKTRGIQ